MSGGFIVSGLLVGTFMVKFVWFYFFWGRFFGLSRATPAALQGHLEVLRLQVESEL